LEEAQAYRETGQLAKAEERYEDVLEADPFNQVATQGIQKIYEERALVAEKARDLSNLERRREVREAWNNIYPKSGTTVGGIEITGAMTASPAYALEKKLQKTIIPQVDFSGADLETIRRALISLSRTYDPEAAKGGVNFVVSTDVANPQPVTLRLRQTSLAEVVRYISQIAGVKARITDIGVTFGPLVEKSPELNSQNFTVSPSFFKGANGKEDVGTAEPRGAAGGSAAAGSDGGGKNEQKKLEDLGVVFPTGAYAVYNQKTSQLKVVNNQEMLDLIGQLISAAEEQTLLIQVGVRLVEINQSDLDTITVNSTLGGSGINLLSPVPAGLNSTSGGSTPSASTQRGVNAQLNQIQGVGLLPNNTLQSFLQSGVLAGTNQTSSYALNTMELGGTILNGMQLRTLIQAVSQKNSANVLANPSIILKRGQKGVIEVVQEFKYVKEYSDPQSSIRTINSTSTNQATANNNLQGVPGPETVIGSFPSQISDPVPIGVKMGVKPDVTGDNSRVLLELEPSFVDFEGFINYGTIINSAYTLAYYNQAVTIMTNNIQQPVFIRRDLTLPAVEVSDGYTLLLGGLLREDIQKIDEKVPIIGDIPIFGRAFQGKTEQAIKKNTLIFVTPRILDVSGQPLNPTAGSPTTASASGTP
jgi:general secretion pathway protein D